MLDLCLLKIHHPLRLPPLLALLYARNSTDDSCWDQKIFRKRVYVEMQNKLNCVEMQNKSKQKIAESVQLSLFH